MGRGRSKRQRRRQAKDRTRPWPRWVELVFVPVLVAVATGIALTQYQAGVALDQAAEQEARAQQGAEQAKDRELAGEPAVRLRVRPMVDTHWAAVFPAPVDEEVLRTGGLSESEDERRRLFTEHGGLLGNYWQEQWADDGLRSTWTHQVSLIGNRRDPVRVLDIRVKVLSRSAPWDGAFIGFPTQGEGDVREVLVDLEDPEGKLLLAPEPGTAEPPKPYLDVKYLTLEHNEEIVLGVTALADQHHYKWELELTVAYGNVDRETIRARSDGTPDGPPFEATGWSSEGNYQGGAFNLEPNYQTGELVMVRDG